MNNPAPLLSAESRQVLAHLHKRKYPQGSIYGSISMDLALDSADRAQELCRPLLDHGLIALNDNRVRITDRGNDWMDQYLHFQEERIFLSLNSDYNFTLLRFLYDQGMPVDFTEFPTVLAEHAPKNTRGYPSMNLLHMVNIELKKYIEHINNKYQLNSSGRRYVEVRAKEINISLHTNTAKVNITTYSQMNLKQEKQQRDQFLQGVYAAARQESPTSPTSILFGLSKYKKYNLNTKELVNNDEDRGGYIIGETLGLSAEQVVSFVSYLCDNSVGYLGSFIGMQAFHITQRGIMYLESLENDPAPTPIHVQHNNITIRDIHSPVQLSQASTHSDQHQAVHQNPEAVMDLIHQLEKDIEQLDVRIRSDFQIEIDYAKKQLQRSKSVTEQLGNIGNLMKDVGVNVFANVLASPIYEAIKPHLFS